MMDGSAVAVSDSAEFDEDAYLSLNPDIAAAIRTGKVESGREHFFKYGRAEGRRYIARNSGNARFTLGAIEGFTAAAANPPRHAIDAVLLTDDGWVFVVGWSDDEANGLQSLRLDGRDWSVELEAAALARVARADVQAALKQAAQRPSGFMGLIGAGCPLSPSRECRVVLRWAGGQQAIVVAPARQVASRELRETVLGFVAAANTGGSQVPAMLGLGNEFAGQVLGLNRAVTGRIVATPFIERFGPDRRAFKGSIVVCLYGRPEYMFLQAALFSGKPGIEDYEFVYVCNSPELLERLLNEARCSALMYGLSQTVVGLPANAGFGPANNIGAAHCRSDRILCVNPDVFPREPGWAAHHTQIVERGGPGSRLFGAALFYDDGSLMHAGMHVALDTGVTIRPGLVESRRFARVEHYGKGAPPEHVALIRPRPVPAVSGAFMSVDRAWFETLGGFSEDYVLGHYEDADLCLRSLQAGEPVWLQDLQLWHLEGRGSRRVSAHEGATLINRWLFSRNWVELVAAGLCDELEAPASPPSLSPSSSSLDLLASDA